MQFQICYIWFTWWILKTFQMKSYFKCFFSPQLFQSFQDKNASPRTSPNLKKSSVIPDHQIDGTKKKLIADQIRQKMRTIMTPLQTPIYKPEKYRPRGKGRPVKSPQALSTPTGMVCRSKIFIYCNIFELYSVFL